MIPACFPAALLLGFLGVQAAGTVRSFEGFLGGIPIWMELEIPAGDGKLRGSYFYKHVGVPLELTGNREEYRFVLQEKDRKGKVTGSFDLGWDDETDSLYGQWSKPAWKGEYESVELAHATPADRRFAVHKYDALVTGNGVTLKRVIDLSRGEFGGKGEVTVSFDRKGILSIGVASYVRDPIETRETEWFLFDLKRKSRIRLEEEMDSLGTERFRRALNPRFEAALRQLRAQRTDAEWQDAMEGWSGDSAFWADPKGALDRMFSASRCDPWNVCLTEVHLDADSIRFGIPGTNFFNLHPVQVEKYERLEFALPVLELLPCLKPGSTLRNLGRGP